MSSGVFRRPWRPRPRRGLSSGVVAPITVSGPTGPHLPPPHRLPRWQPPRRRVFLTSVISIPVPIGRINRPVPRRIQALSRAPKKFSISVAAAPGAITVARQLRLRPKAKPVVRPTRRVLPTVPPVTILPFVVVRPLQVPKWLHRIEEFRPSTRRASIRKLAKPTVPPVITLPTLLLRPLRIPMWLFRPIEFRPSTRRAVVRVLPPVPGLFEALLPLGQAAIGPGIQTLSSPPITRIKRQFNRNVSALRRDSVEDTIEELMRAIQDIHGVLDEVRDQPFAARNVDADGLPSHGEYCPSIDGQYLRLGEAGVDAPFNQRVMHRGSIQSVVASNTSTNTPATITLTAPHALAFPFPVLCRIFGSFTGFAIDGWHIANLTSSTTLTIEQPVSVGSGQFGTIDLFVGGYVAVEHGLGRVPQGMIQLNGLGWPARIFIVGEGPVPDATDQVVYFQVFGSADLAVVIF